MYTITFWGVMGSVAGANQDMLSYGSNTSCLSIHSEQVLVFFDAGTGIVHSSHLCKNFSRIHVFLTHYHYDHIIGLPFWSAIYDEHKTIYIHGPTLEGVGVQEAVTGLFKTPYLPIEISQIKAKIVFIEEKEGVNQDVDTLKIRSMVATHPGGAFIYRLCTGRHCVLYLTDLDCGLMPKEALVEFCMNADLMYLDAHFTPHEYLLDQFKDWGHSSIDCARALKSHANVKKIYLGHHAPHRREEDFKYLLTGHEVEGLYIAREGSTFKIGGSYEV
jgi:ribonuclease BN (tRNA processing enzyme)